MVIVGILYWYQQPNVAIDLNKLGSADFELDDKNERMLILRNFAKSR